MNSQSNSHLNFNPNPISVEFPQTTKDQQNPRGYFTVYLSSTKLKSKIELQPLKLELSSPRKRESSFRKLSSLFGTKKKVISPSLCLNDVESKKLKEKLANINATKKKSLVKHMKHTSITMKLGIKDIPTPNYLWIIFFVKKFISILKINVLLKKLTRMKTYHYNMIGDKTHYNADYGMLYSIMRENNPFNQNEIQKKNFTQRLVENIEKTINFIMNILTKFEVFQPDKLIISIWNFIMLFFVMINAFYIPMKIGYEIEESKIDSTIFIIFEEIPVWVFIVDIIISLNTAYYSKGVFVNERYKIIKHYFKSYALLDLFTIGPFLLGYFSSLNYVEMLFLLRILKLNSSIKKLEEFLQLRNLYGGHFQLIKLMGLIFYIAHLSCCGWHYLASVEISYGVANTWLDLLNIRNAEWQVKYVNSLYYSIVTMVTVGYGDITPQNTAEKIFAIIYIGMACGVFAYGVSEVGTILKDMYKSETDFK